MFKKLISFSFAFCVLFQFSLIANSYEKHLGIEQNMDLMPVNCSPQLQPFLKKMLKVPEIRTLIASIQKEGPINIIVNNHQLSNQFGAFWDLDQRNVCVSLSRQTSEGDIIGSILFELHNAAANSKLQYLDQLATTSGIDRESYVEAVEFVEYENSLKASKIAKKGISLGIFPSDAVLPTYENFEEHYRYQKIGGHSAWIAKNYDQLVR